ncbi:MAG: MarR family transcriptional regulator [Thermodesulfobacteriota bacterium]|nr:MarR family transcriptional regulator [Thermodesulfobacteriota bacterium]
MLNNPDDPRSCVCFLLSRAAQAAQKHLRQHLEPYGLTPAQYLIIECLWITDKLSPKLIGELVRYDSATLTGLIDRLERSGFVFRERDPDDRRAIRICLTEKSIQLKDELRALRCQANEEILKVFPTAQRGAFKHALVSLISGAEMVPAGMERKL